MMSDLSLQSAVKRTSIKTSQRRGASRKVKSGVLVISLANGCVCCSIRDDLLAAVLKGGLAFKIPAR